MNPVVALDLEGREPALVVADPKAARALLMLAARCADVVPLTDAWRKASDPHGLVEYLCAECRTGLLYVAHNDKLVCDGRRHESRPHPDHDLACPLHPMLEVICEAYNFDPEAEE